MSDGTLVRDETITLDGLCLHYRDWGDLAAPPLVLLHAYLMHARSWDTFARAMAERFRVLALDQRGHGESGWAADYHEQRLLGDLAAFVDALRLGTFSAVGFSIGGYAVAGYAALYPDRIKCLVLAECFALETSPEAAAHLHALRSLPADFQGAAAVATAASAFRPLVPYAPEDELRHWMGAGLTQAPDGRWTWRSDPVLRLPGPPGRLNPSPNVFAERLAGVRSPTLLVVGERSFHASGAEHVAKVNPLTRVATVPQAGHWVPLDNPPGFLEVVRGFLAEE
jgi:pimeloyl-ACP methyl ester carboxylesterase